MFENGNSMPMRLAGSSDIDFILFWSKFCWFWIFLVGVTPGKLPRTILPAQRNLWTAILDTIVGDGPSKRFELSFQYKYGLFTFHILLFRYALICKSCNSHNGLFCFYESRLVQSTKICFVHLGMALEEEFEYLGRSNKIDLSKFCFVLRSVSCEFAGLFWEYVFLGITVLNSSRFDFIWENERFDTFYQRL